MIFYSCRFVWTKLETSVVTGTDDTGMGLCEGVLLTSNVPHCTVMLQATRNVLRISEQINDMLADWRELNFVEISKMSVFVAQQDADPDSDLIREGISVIIF